MDRLGAEDQADPHPRGGDHPADAWVIQHIQDPETAEELAEACREIFGRGPVFVSEVGPVLGAHVGPRLMGVGGITEEALG
jgi:fatty acid-binding protein DegV